MRLPEYLLQIGWVLCTDEVYFEGRFQGIRSGNHPPSTQMQTTAFDFIYPVPSNLAVETEYRLLESMVAAGFPSPVQEYFVR